MRFRRITAAVMAATTPLWAGTAGARQADGTLGVIVTPNNGAPAFAAPGGTFEAELTKETPLRLGDGADARELAAEFTPLPGGGARALCRVPADTPPGLYAISGGGDTTARSVAVRAEFPEYYAFAHVSDVHIGKANRPQAPDAVFAALTAELNGSGAAFAAVTGDLTESGEADQFRRFIGILDTCTLPTVVCAGNHDRQGDNYERFFGPLTSRFTFGSDGYLVFDTKDFDTADGATAQDGLLHRFRRELKPCRWTFGLTHRYEPAMGMRAQLTLFVDDPLDGLFFGHIHRELREGENIPWGRTAAWAVPAAVDGRYRMVDVTRQGPMPRAAARAGGETEKAE